MKGDYIDETISYKNVKKHSRIKLGEKEIYVLHTSFEQPVDPERWSYYINLLPEHLRTEVLKYRRWEDRHNCLFGKLLVYSGYYIFTGNEISFGDFIRDVNGRPYIRNGPINFNISHSCGNVCCGFSTNEIGIDIEEIRDVDSSEFKDVFTGIESAAIKKNGNLKFYEIWTKKESISKALGKGFLIPFQDIEINDHTAFYNKKNWSTKGYQIQNSYCSIASAVPLTSVQHIYIDF